MSLQNSRLLFIIVHDIQGLSNGKECCYFIVFTKLDPERKVKCYNGYFINGYMFHTEENRHERKTYSNGVCVKGSTCSEFEVNYYSKLEEVVKLQYHSKQNKVFLFKCYWYDTTNRGIRVDPHYGLVKINSKARLCNVNDVFVFA